MPMQDEICRQIYSDTKSFYEKTITSKEIDSGFQILYGPPHHQARVLFIGYQPGRGIKTALEERKYGSEKGWPEESEFVTQKWRLATNLQQMFGDKFLNQCVGTNAIFMRADSIRAYKETHDKPTRDCIESFCMEQVKKIVKIVEPHIVVAIGLGTLALFDTRGEADLKNRKGRILTKKGKMESRNILGVLHLSGAFISDEDRKRIAERIVELSKPNFSQIPGAL